MRRFLTTAAVVCVAAGSLAFSSNGSAPEYLFTDVAGDANAINGQGFDDATGDTPTGPAQVASADILGFRSTGVYVRQVAEDGSVTHRQTQVQFRTKYAAQPTATSAPVINRVVATAGGCSFQANVLTGTNGQAGTQAHMSASMRLLGGCGVNMGTLGEDETFRGNFAVASWDAANSELVLTVDLDAAPDKVRKNFFAGQSVTITELHNRLNTGAVTAPVIDDVQPSFAFFEIGEDKPADEPAPEPAPAE